MSSGYLDMYVSLRRQILRELPCNMQLQIMIAAAVMGPFSSLQQLHSLAQVPQLWLWLVGKLAVCSHPGRCMHVCMGLPPCRCSGRCPWG